MLEDQSECGAEQDVLNLKPELEETENKLHSGSAAEAGLVAEVRSEHDKGLKKLLRDLCG